MTWDHIEGKWKRYSGSLTERWGKLIRDDAVILRGKRDQLLGLIRERYGIREKDAEAQVDEFISSLWSRSCESRVSSSTREQAPGAR